MKSAKKGFYVEFTTLFTSQPQTQYMNVDASSPAAAKAKIYKHWGGSKNIKVTLVQEHGSEDAKLEAAAAAQEEETETQIIPEQKSDTMTMTIEVTFKAKSQIGNGTICEPSKSTYQLSDSPATATKIEFWQTADKEEKEFFSNVWAKQLLETRFPNTPCHIIAVTVTVDEA